MMVTAPLGKCVLLLYRPCCYNFSHEVSPSCSSNLKSQERKQWRVYSSPDQGASRSSAPHHRPCSCYFPSSPRNGLVGTAALEASYCGSSRYYCLVNELLYAVSSCPQAFIQFWLGKAWRQDIPAARATSTHTCAFQGLVMMQGLLTQ